MKKNCFIGLLFAVCAQPDIFSISSRTMPSEESSLSGLVPPPQPTSSQLAPSARAKKFAQQNASSIAQDIMKNNTRDEVSDEDVRNELNVRNAFSKQLFNIIDRDFIVGAVQGAIDVLQQQPTVDDQSALEQKYQEEQAAIAAQQADFEKQKEAMRKQEEQEQKALRNQLDRQKKEQDRLRKELQQEQDVLDQQTLRKIIQIVKELAV